ncbi:hypothetical protein [Burkholderia pyrrocinia]|uniref:hypothetical protein n=1 Tax=Burkholderia pyrrocinia TaxID=60550 RepID=UPI00158E140D|nr:hypothetical protein [Burkholderia pyrrocinia]
MKLNRRINFIHASEVSCEFMSFRLFHYMAVLLSALIPLSTYAVNDVQFIISLEPGALVGYDGIQLIGYATGPNPSQHFPFSNPMSLLPGTMTATPAIPTAIVEDNDHYVVADDRHVRLIFRLTGSPIYMTPDATDIMARLTITEAAPSSAGGQGTAGISAIGTRPVHAGDPAPSLRFAPSIPVNFAPNAPLTLDLRITGAVAPMTAATIPAFILLGSG